MNRQLTLILAAVWCATIPWGCASPSRPQVETEEESGSLAIARRDLVVLPVFNNYPVSGFPISSRNVISAAHAFSGTHGIAAVQGRPMMVPPPFDLYDKLCPNEHDWTIICATTDQFQPNLIDGTLKLHKGDEVFIGGFRAVKKSYDAVWHSGRTPEIIRGHVFSPEVSVDSPSVVAVEVPAGDYHGFSGGPAAIVDSEGQVRIWGVAVAADREWDGFPSWCFHQLLYVARLPQEHLELRQPAPGCVQHDVLAKPQPP